MSSAGEWASAGLMLLVVGVIAWLVQREIRMHRDGQSLGSKGHLVFRLIVGGTLAVLVILVFVGKLWYPEPELETVRSGLNYWTHCAFLGYILSMVAIVDIIIVFRLRRQHRDSLEERCQATMAEFTARATKDEQMSDF